MVVGWSDFAMGAHTCNRGEGTPRRLPQSGARRIRNKLSIFKGVRLPFCAPRLIWRHFFIAQHFCEADATGGRGPDRITARGNCKALSAPKCGTHRLACALT